MTSEDRMIDKYDFQAKILNYAVSKGFQKGEICLLFELLEDINDFQNAKKSYEMCDSFYGRTEDKEMRRVFQGLKRKLKEVHG